MSINDWKRDQVNQKEWEIDELQKENRLLVSVAPVAWPWLEEESAKQRDWKKSEGKQSEKKFRINRTARQATEFLA